MATFSTVACSEVYSTAAEDRTFDDWTASVQLRCAWTDRYNLVNDIFLNYRPWPYHAPSEILYAQNAATVPEEGEYIQDGQGMQYAHALVTVNYGVPGKDDRPDPTNFVSETLEPRVEYLTQEPTEFYWEGDPFETAIEEEPTIQLRKMRLTRTLFNVTSLNSDLLDLPGSCNNAQYISALLGLTFPVETLLFGPPQLSRTILTDGSTEGWNVRLSFEYEKEGWNKFFRPDATGPTKWLSLFIRGSSPAEEYKPYPPSDFSNWLF